MSDKEELSELLKQASSTLRKHNRDRWADWLSKDSKLIDDGDFYGVEHFLIAMKGVSSLTDVKFHPANGDRIGIKKVKKFNSMFRKKITKAHALANNLQREEFTQFHRTDDIYR